jgi:hypothetical protein
MSAATETRVQYLVGDKNTLTNARPLPALDDRACAFVSALSTALLADPRARAYPDVVTFAYWCRWANVTKLKESLGDAELRLGWGLAFHITPSNVPINFAFSFVFSLLAGNANLVRVPSRPFPQVGVVCDVVNELLAQPAHHEIRKLTVFVRYEQNEAITTEFSRDCQVRIIWGGDAAINAIRKIPVPERCIEVAFTDRYSFCVLGAARVAEATDAELQTLAAAFYNDAYLFDQNACSSPRMLVWLGTKEQAAAAQGRFWKAVAAVVEQRYLLPPVNAVDKFVFVCATAIEQPWVRRLHRHGNYIYRLEVDGVSQEVEHLAAKFGVFVEHTTESLHTLEAIVSPRCQTLTHYGVEKQALRDFVVGSRLKGIDRVVPVGTALDIGPVWDGYDLIKSLSRVVNVK